MRYLIHSTVDPETGAPLENYYSQIPIPKGTEFVVQHGSRSLKFRMIERWITNERYALVELVTEQPVPCRPIPKRPIVGEKQC